MTLIRRILTTCATLGLLVGVSVPEAAAQAIPVTGHVTAGHHDAQYVMTPVGTGMAAGQTPPSTALSGSDLYYNNCAACHGKTGKGDGPTGLVLKTRPADLTIIAKNSGGTFPAAKIYKLIDGRDPEVRGHGGPDMPVWGEVFAARGGKASVKPRIDALVRHLEMLQVP